MGAIPQGRAYRSTFVKKSLFTYSKTMPFPDRTHVCSECHAALLELVVTSFHGEWFKCPVCGFGMIVKRKHQGFDFPPNEDNNDRELDPSSQEQ